MCCQIDDRVPILDGATGREAVEEVELDAVCTLSFERRPPSWRPNHCGHIVTGPRQ